MFRGSSYVPDAEVPRAGFRDFDLKSRFSFGTLKIVGRWNISKIKSTFEVEIFVRRFIELEACNIRRASELFFSPRKFQNILL